MGPDSQNTLPRAPATPADVTNSLPANAASALPKPVHCENCGALITQTYCGVCGQRLEPPVHSLWHFAQVATEDLTHADSRLWRTLGALLFKPGYLTQQFLAGRRARYLPPVRLYLVLSVVFFLFASATQTKLEMFQISRPDGGMPKSTLAPLEGENTIPLDSAQGGPIRRTLAHTGLRRICAETSTHDCKRPSGALQSQLRVGEAQRGTADRQ